MLGQIGVGLALVQLADAAMAEDVADLADGMGLAPGLGGDVEDRPGRRAMA